MRLLPIYRVYLGLILVFGLLLIYAWGPTVASPPTVTTMSYLPEADAQPLVFVRNNDLSDPSRLFYAYIPGAVLTFRNIEVAFAPYTGQPNASSPPGVPGSTPPQNGVVAGPSATPVLQIQLKDADPHVRVEGGTPVASGDPSQPTRYTDLLYTGTYPQVDLHFSGTADQLLSTYTVNAGGNPAVIRWRYQGANLLKLNWDGSLQVLFIPPMPPDAPHPTLIVAAPAVWQEIGGQKRMLKAHYVIAPDDSLSVEVEGYDAGAPLLVEVALDYRELFQANPTGAPTTPTPTPTPTATSQSDCRTFAETNKTVCGRFLQYWDDHGGLAQQGYPISGEMQETSLTDGKLYTVQYFERAVFELHPENVVPNDVLLSLLGNFRYKEKYPDGAPGQKANKRGTYQTFPETGYTIGGDFFEYWRTHGGLPQQGFPISDEFQEKSDLDGKTYTVQYFERAVFEYHPENAPPYNVLLSQLGTFQYKARYGAGSGP